MEEERIETLEVLVNSKRGSVFTCNEETPLKENEWTV